MKTLLTLFLIAFFTAGQLFSQTTITDSLKGTINPDSVYTTVDTPAEHPEGKEARVRLC